MKNGRQYVELEPGLPGSQEYCTCGDGKHPKWEHWDPWNHTYTLCHVGACLCSQFEGSGQFKPPRDHSRADVVPIAGQS